ncbi:MAG TPA: prepilin peptidase [Luteolibacter sp.]|nr:prepilin peptidase [Luteolibacter sp.]
MFPPLDHWLWYIPAICIGACVGSFLNVVIYRVPLGLSVNEPKRSFCPKCKNAIPMRRNIPLLSWLLLRGKCADCKAPIAFRYFAVEFLTMVLFAAVWWMFPPIVALPLWAFMALVVSITFIDAEHLIIPTGLTWGGTAAGLIGCVLWPQLPVMAGFAGDWKSGLLQGGIGWVAGFFGLWAVVELGKMAFGKKAMKFERPVEWMIKEPVGDQDPMLFIIDGEEIAWWDIFSRKTDRLIVETTDIRINHEPVGYGTLIIREMEIELPDGSVKRLEDVKAVDGLGISAVIPREAMGMGDVHLLGMIGAFFGWTGVLFSLFGASLFAIAAALIGRIGFGRQLPFGPFLVMGSLAWMFGGWKLWQMYVGFIGLK